MSHPPLFLLAIDHRNSFEKLFALTPPIADSDAARLRNLKRVVVDALGDAERDGLDGAGVLIDDRYGRDAIAVAEPRGVTVAIAFERSGQQVVQFEHDDWRSRLDDLAGRTAPSYAKILIRHRADGDAADVATQLARLAEFSAACTERSVPFLLELITPLTAAERDGDDATVERRRTDQIVAAIDQIQAAAVDADVWKVEGSASVDDCRRVAAQATAGGRDDVGVVVLGAGAPAATVEGWLAAGAAAGYRGFAVGRSIWAEPLLQLDAGGIDELAARAEIARRYLSFVESFR